MVKILNQRPTKICKKPDQQRVEKTLHPAWQELMKLCESMRYGEIERLKIHDGFTVLAEVTRQKVKLI
jgi:hypothetical protein